MKLTTLNGKFDSRCALCGRAVYSLWVSDERPPVGCSDGHDATPWTCSHVLGTLTMAVMRLDYLHADLLPHHQQAIEIVGKQRAGEIMAHIRKHHRAPGGSQPREPNYDAPTFN